MESLCPLDICLLDALSHRSGVPDRALSEHARRRWFLPERIRVLNDVKFNPTVESFSHWRFAAALGGLSTRGFGCG
jgi:hypothetical protein